jgi:hypothetical protein
VSVAGPLSVTERFIAEQPLDQLHEIAAHNLTEWLNHPSTGAMFWVGVACGTIIGHDPLCTLEAAVTIVRDRIEAGDLVPPPGPDPLVIAGLVLLAWAVR